ncbi:MAG: hypothetical protein ABIH65_01830 [Nanoarchaeota archaeon]
MKIVLTPDWFIGIDVVIQFFSLIVLLLVIILAINNYKKNKENRNLLYLGLGFTLITLAQLASILTKLVLYYDIGPSQAIGQAIISSNFVSSIDIFYYMGFFFFKFLTLLGFYIIYRLPRERKSIMDYVIVLYFIVLSVIIEADFCYIFYITSFIMLIAIVEKYYLVYRENKFFNTKILMIVFAGLALSQLIFALYSLENLFAIANIIELISYIILLFLIIRILQHGTEKKSYADNIRYAGNYPGQKHSRH